jgi:hypothetical protein
MSAPGGFMEVCTDTATRPRLLGRDVDLPQRGPFLYPPPYSTRGIRLTNEEDTGPEDRVRDGGYSYWDNINAHRGQPVLWVFVSIKGLGACLYEVDKTTFQVTPKGPLFPHGHPLANETAEGWYWSFTDPNLLYCPDDTHLWRLHVRERVLEMVIDINPIPGRTDEILRQWHTDASDHVHSATVRAGESRGWQNMGTIVYREGELPWSWYPRTGPLDESQIDKSGNWLLIKENIDGRNGEDNRFIHAPTRAEVRVLLDEDGAGGHSDLGYGYMVAADNWNGLPNAVRVWKLDGSSPQGLVVYRGVTWDAQIHHVAHANARPGDYMPQVAYGSGAQRLHLPRTNEILGFPLDGSLRVQVIAPCLVDMDALGGGGGVGDDYDYFKLPKANVDPCGQFIFLTTNMGGPRLDAFLVCIPPSPLAIVECSA